MVEREEAAIKFFVTHQQFAKSVEPAVGHFNDPASDLLFRIAFELGRFLSSALDVGNIAVLLTDFQGRRPGVTCVSTQVFTSSLERIGTLDYEGIEHRLQLRDIMPIGSGHDE